jgi:PKD-like domain/Secretion system C-terminal sorting domain
MKKNILLGLLCFGNLISFAQQFYSDSSQIYYLNSILASSKSVTAFDDGNSGAYVFWLDGRTGVGKTAIYFQHINKYGIAQYPQNGKKIIHASSNSISSYKAIKTQSGFIVAWNLNTPVYPDSLFCNSFSFNGSPLWLAPTLVSSRAANMISVTGNGLNIMPTDSGFFINYSTVYFGGSEGFGFNRIDTSGNLRWPVNYHQINSNGYYWTSTSDKHNGFFYAVTTGGIGAHIYVQHFNLQGVKSYASEVDISLTAGGRGNSALKIVCDNDTNLYVVWESNISGTLPISKIKAQGGLAWSPDYRLLSSGAGTRTSPEVLFLNNSIYSIWSDSRPPAGFYFVYAQRTDSNGNMLWTADGDSIERLGSYSPNPKVIATKNGELFMSSLMSPGFLGQLKDSSGALKWQTNGRYIHTSNNSPFYDDYALVSTSDTAVIATWVTYNGEVCAAKISQYGNLFNPIPLPNAASTVAGNDMVCEGASNVIYSTTTIPNATKYLWHLSNGITSANGNDTTLTPSIAVNFSTGISSAAISVSGLNNIGEGAKSPELAIILSALPGAAGIISGNDSAAACINQNGFVYSINQINNATSYNWTLPANAIILGTSDSNSIVVNYGPYSSSGNISVAASNVCGSGIPSVLPIHYTPIPSAEICYATVDSALQKTILFWQKPTESFVDAYVIFREIAGTYLPIDTVSNNVFSSYLDVSSQPILQAENYKLAVLDSCGNTGDVSNSFSHKTINLYGSIQPAGITKLYWNDYIGSNDPGRYFNLLRDTLGNGAFNDTLAKNLIPANYMNFSDVNSINYPLCRYVVEMVSNSNCTPGFRILLNKSTSRSNIKNKTALFDSSSVGINQLKDINDEISIYPNPAKDFVSITSNHSKIVSITLLDVLGKIICKSSSSELVDHSGIIKFSIQGVNPGLYLLKINSDGFEKLYKLVIK